MNKKSEVEIWITDEYDRFKFLVGNRKLENKIIAKIGRSIDSDFDLSEYRPVLVNASMRIIDGQHQFETLKMRGLPVHYIVVKKKIHLLEIARMNSAQGPWQVSDYMHLYTTLEYKPYQELDKYCSDLDIPVTVGATVLAGGYKKDKFEEGKFTVSTKRKSMAAEFSKAMQFFQDKYAFASTKSFAMAVLHVMSTPGFSMERMIKKISEVPDIIRKSGNQFDYIRQLEGTYNYNMTKSKLRFSKDASTVEIEK